MPTLRSSAPLHTACAAIRSAIETIARRQGDATAIVIAAAGVARGSLTDELLLIRRGVRGSRTR